MTTAETAEPFKQPRQSWFWWAMMVLPFLAALVLLADLVSYLMDPASYPIGWEGGGWVYRSDRNFFLGRVLWVLPQVLCICGFFFGQSLLVARLVQIWASFVTAVMSVAILYTILQQTNVIAN